MQDSRGALFVWSQHDAEVVDLNATVTALIAIMLSTIVLLSQSIKEKISHKR